MKKLIRLLLLIPILITLIEPIHINAAAAQASGALLASGPGTTLYLPLVNKDHDIWPAVVILNGYDPDYPIQVPPIDWLPISGAQFYQVRLVSLNSEEIYYETVSTNWYEIWKEGHWQVSVRAGDAFYWAPWSQPIVVTSYIGSIFGDSTPTDLTPNSQSPAHTAFPQFEWEPVRHTHWGWHYYDDTFEIQMDDDADYSSPFINEILAAGTLYKKMVKTYRVTTGESPIEIVDVKLHLGTTYYWRVRQIFRDTYYSNWSSATFSVETPYTDCLHNSTGKVSFSIGMNPIPGQPIFGGGWIDPYDPAIGAQQTFHMDVGVTPPQGNPIQSVTMYGMFDSGQEYTYPAALVSGSALTSGGWEATYSIPESYCYNYSIRTKAVNALGQINAHLVLR